MKRRDFIRSTAAFASVTMLPSSVWALTKNGKLRTAHIGVGGMMGGEDLLSISSHPMVEVTALCDVDSTFLAAAKKLHPGAKTFTDYRRMFDTIGKDIDAVCVCTPDHTHAPASIMAMNMGKPVYCQKPLTHHVSEARAMKKLAADNNLITQMGIQCHSSPEYRQAVDLIKSGIVGKVSTVRAWSPKNWGYDGDAPAGSDPVPETLDWNLWLGTSPDRDYKKDVYHPANWRKLLDYGCGTLGDMGVHIFDTPYSALELTLPETVKTKCRKPNGFSHPENNTVEYEFPKTKYTTDNFKWVWYDGPGAPKKHRDLKLPDKEILPEQGAMFVGEKGNLLLPHWDYPKLIIDGKYEKIDFAEIDENDHYHQFVDACLGKDNCSAPLSYAANLTEAILLGVIANRFPNKTLHWDIGSGKFVEAEANELLDFKYRDF
jgi:predicted dehydrogenase